MEGRRGRKGKAGKPYLSFLGEVVLPELKKVALRHRKVLATAVGTVTGLMLAVPLLSSPLLLKMSLHLFGPLGTAGVIFFMAINNASIVLAGPKRASQRSFLSLFLFFFSFLSSFFWKSALVLKCTFLLPRNAFKISKLRGLRR